jgi:hypothetical protein
MTHFQKIGDGANVWRVKNQLEAHHELWDQHTIRKTAPNTPHSGMSDIWVRYNDVKKYEESGDYRTFNDAHVPVWYPAWTVIPSLKPIVLDLMAATEGEMLGGVLITRIPPGHGIAPHTDDGWHVQYYDKFYVCIQNDPGATFWCEHDGVKEGLEPKEGEVWLFDNRKLHWVENNSVRDRITLIVCIRTEKYGRVS